MTDIWRKIEDGAGRILDWIYPPRCMLCKCLLDEGEGLCEVCRALLLFIGRPRCPVCGRPDALTEAACADCEGKDFYFERNIAIFTYDDVMKDLIHAFKYHNHPSYGKGLGRLAAQALPDGALQGVDAVAPVPLFRGKEKRRGYNQAALLAVHIAREAKLPFYKDLLIRTRDTIPQSRLRAGEREKNLEGAFAVNPKYAVKTKCFLIIDDIYTTGKTISCCAEALADKGAARAVGLTLTIAVRNDRMAEVQKF